MDHTRGRLQAGLREIHEDVGAFSAALYPARTLRGYQLPFARAVAESVLAGGGQEFAAVFSRQSGKDEALAQRCASGRRAQAPAFPSMPRVAARLGRVADVSKMTTPQLAPTQARDAYILQM